MWKNKLKPTEKLDYVKLWLVLLLSEEYCAKSEQDFIQVQKSCGFTALLHYSVTSSAVIKSSWTERMSRKNNNFNDWVSKKGLAALKLDHFDRTVLKIAGKYSIMFIVTY